MIPTLLLTGITPVRGLGCVKLFPDLDERVVRHKQLLHEEFSGSEFVVFRQGFVRIAKHEGDPGGRLDSEQMRCRYIGCLHVMTIVPERSGPSLRSLGAFSTIRTRPSEHQLGTLWSTRLTTGQMYTKQFYSYLLNCVARY